MTARALEDGRPLTSPADLAGVTWDDLQPRYDELAETPVAEATAREWLGEWSDLEALLGEAMALASIAYTTDTQDPAKEALHLRFVAEIGPRADEQHVRLGRILLDSGCAPPEVAMMTRRLENQVRLFREENLPLAAELQRLGARYQKLTAAITVPWEGQDLTLPRLHPHEAAPERDVRERAFRLHFQPYLQMRDEVNDIFDLQLELRRRMAANAGFASYRDYVHAEKNRFDYSPADCQRFHEAVRRSVVPAVERVMERRRRLLGVDRLRPWDAIDSQLGVADPLGRPPLAPFQDGADLAERAQRVLDRTDRQLAGYFRTMREEGLLDLESRKGKAAGGYCRALPFRKRSFIFMNAAGSANDVRTLFHEAGHAFHGFEAADAQPLVFLRHPGSEMAEVASMSMELLASRHLDGGAGYYSAEEARRAESEHLEAIPVLLAHVASVDAFQQWIYTHEEGADRDARDAAWLRIREELLPAVDWSGLEAERVARWYAQPHFFLYPFYYIEYGIAQLGALQVWRNSLADPAGAIAAYRRALALGGSRPLPELFQAAGARLVFDPEGMAELIALVEARLAELGDGLRPG